MKCKKLLVVLIVLVSQISLGQPPIKNLGTYNSMGFPNYLEPTIKNVSSDFINRISAAVPENQPVPDYHPSYLNSNYSADITLIETADVYISFVMEGAGYKNVLGFYTFPTGYPPQSTAEIDSITIVFPNVSRLNSGGELLPGHTVNIGNFSAGTTIGFVVFANGFKNSQVTYGQWQHYSDKNLNPPSDESLKQHSIVLHDQITERYVISFEDITRPRGDRDFNDAVFFGTANPPNAIESYQIPNLPIVWEGNVSSDWNNIYNWNPNVIPDSSSSVTISSNASNTVVIDEEISVDELVVEPGATFITTSDAEIDVKGDYTANTEVDGDIVFSGDTNQSIYGEGTLMNVTVANGHDLNVQNNIVINGNLVLENSDFNTNNNSVTLLGNIESNGLLMNINGEVNGELTFARIIPNKTGYHYLSSPISNATLADINDDFTLLSLGGDLSSSPFPNIYIYNETDPSTHNTDGWSVPNNLEHPMSPGHGFATHINANTRVDWTGIPNNGPISVPLSYTFSGELPEDHPMCPPDGWNLLGNPYPSVLDWSAIEKDTNIYNGLYMWNPLINQYATSVAGVYVNGGSDRIAPFQGFFIRTNGPASIEFKNSHRRIDTNETTTFHRKEGFSMLKIMIEHNGNSDETAFAYRIGATNNFDENYDAYKMFSSSSSSPQIYSEDEKIQYSINSFSSDKSFFDELPIEIFAPAKGSYKISLGDYKFFPEYTAVYLEDEETGKSYNISNSPAVIKLSTGDHKKKIQHKN